eukprot:519587_1
MTTTLTTITTFCIYITLVICQNDFIGRKYSTINNISTIDHKSSSGFKTVISPSLVKYSGNPLFGQDKPWETRIDNGYPNVVYTSDAGNKTYQLWYDSFIPKDAGGEGTLYAQSTDGIKWIKPNLGLVKINNSANNNIMFANSGGVGIFKDIYTKNDSERYKAFGQLDGMHSNNKGGTAVSSDGLHWTDIRYLNLYNRWDCHNNMFYDIGYPVTVDKYFAITRGPDFPPRTVAISKSGVNNFWSSYTKADVVESGGNDNQTYSQITMEYYDIFLGLVMIYDSTSQNQRVYCELAWSPNMYDWYRVNPGDQLIPLSPLKPVTYDSYICFTAGYPVVVDGAVRLYYFGGNGPHSGARESFFAMANMRMDGFAGIMNEQKGEVANVNTFKLAVQGKYLCVTMDVVQGVDGSIDVVLENKNGFESGSVNKNVTNFALTWKNGNDLTSLIGQDVVIQFQLTDAILYTFQFANTTSC